MSCVKHKDPDAKLNYGLDWSEWLDAGETIASSVWDVPTGLSEFQAALFTDTVTQVFLDVGGTPGEYYDLTNRITTSPSGYTDERTLTVYMVQK